MSVLLGDGPLTRDMDPGSAYGDQMARYLRLGKAPSLLVRAPQSAPIVVTRLRSEHGLRERTANIPREGAFVVSVHLTSASEHGCELWTEGRYARITEWPPGGIGIYDLRAGLQKRSLGPVDWVHYHVPQETLDAFTDAADVGRIRSLECVRGRVDAVLHGLTQAILPSLESPVPPSERFLEHFRLLFCTHLAETYVPSFIPVRIHRGGLAPWQKNRAGELISEHLDGSLRLSTLARECGLSVSHFARSFRQSFGTSAHHYLILQRVERAKDLLLNGGCSLSEAALLSGFADQAAFTRAFKASVGVPPGRWRKEVQHRRPPVIAVGPSVLPRTAVGASTDDFLRC
jgi:AraC family transcriptional regulator